MKFWHQKFKENQQRDIRNYDRLKKMGWRVVVLWQCETKTIEHATAVLTRYFKE
jgi:DNA mismatch endonuclease (patch repair protein)